MAKGEIQKSSNKIPSRQGGAQSIRRSIAILRSVSKYDETGARLHQIAKAMDLPTPTVHRILTVLLEENFLSFDIEGKTYRLGAELYYLGAATQRISIRDRYHTSLQRISGQTGDGTCLVIPSGYDGLCIDHIPGKYRIQVLGFDIDERRPLGIGAACLALLSFLPEKQREDIIAANAPRYMMYYGIEDKEVRSWTKRTLKLKYSNSSHIVSPESVGVGAPIFNKKGQVVAAISMAGITSRMTSEKRRETARIILSEIVAVDPPPD
jgi:DNA-binding IclR family transcriptional regulator